MPASNVDFLVFEHSNGMLQIPRLLSLLRSLMKRLTVNGLPSTSKSAMT